MMIKARSSHFIFVGLKIKSAKLVESKAVWSRSGLFAEKPTRITELFKLVQYTFKN